MASIYQPQNSSYYWIKYYYNGKCYRESLKVKDKKTANYLKSKKEQELTEKGLPPALKSITLQKALDDYLNYSAATKAKSTHSLDKMRLTYLIKSMPLKLNDLTQKNIQDFLTSIIASGRVTHITANGYLGIIRAFLNWCIRNEYLVKNPMKGMKKYRIESNPPRFFNEKEIESLMRMAKDQYPDIYPILAIALYTGLRKSEIFRLEAQDIDFKRDKIGVYNKAGSPTKSKKFRIIELHPKLKAILGPWKDHKGPCFKRIKAKILSQVFRKAGLKPRGDKKIGLHTLRHTFASHLIMNGVPIRTVQDMLGHADIQTTMIYSHLSPRHVNDALVKLDY